MSYPIKIHRTDEGYSISVPAMQGCWSEGNTRKEAMENIRAAIREYRAALKATNRSQRLQE